MTLLLRPKVQRLMMAPAHFMRLLRIGEGDLPFWLRLRVALNLTWILVTYDRP